MAIWRGSTKTPSVGPDVHIKFKYFDSPGSEYGASATEALSLARLMIRQMSTKAQRGLGALTSNQRDILDYYFVLNGGGQAASFPIIQGTLKMIESGLYSGDLALKVTGEGSALGYVNSHHKSFGKMDKLRDTFGLNKDGWTKGQRVLNSGTRLLVHRGDIHLSSDRLDTGPELAAKTIIHEASHKFASTGDFGEKGYTWDGDGTFRAPGLTAAEALNNAESYARFVMMSFLFPN